jgi:glycosyltransferase involved in cell wall biosynthesis
MRITIVTDAWAPQVNGVVRTLERTRAELETMGHDVSVIAPHLFRSVPCPTYPEIRLAVAAPGVIARRIERTRPDAIHISTEGPLGLSARRWCRCKGLPFTTAYHTQFPDYVAKRTGLPAELFWRYIRWFHRPASATLVATPSIADQLLAHGIDRLRYWSRGVDLGRFSIDGPRHPALAQLPRPIQLYVGRVAVEKNIDAFLEADVPGSKVVVGDGPALARLKAAHPHAIFAGPLFGDDLAAAYRSADVFVFPSRTDTFGLVMIEALACGTPVAAYPVAGPADVLDSRSGVTNEDLGIAIREALRLDRGDCAQHAATFTWSRSARQFLDALAPIDKVQTDRRGLPAGTVAA